MDIVEGYVFQSVGDIVLEDYYKMLGEIKHNVAHGLVTILSCFGRPSITVTGVTVEDNGRATLSNPVGSYDCLALWIQGCRITGAHPSYMMMARVLEKATPDTPYMIEGRSMAYTVTGGSWDDGEFIIETSNGWRIPLELVMADGGRISKIGKED